MTGTERLVQNNRAYAHTHQPPQQESPSTGVAVVRCMDHRIHISDVLGVAAGDIDQIANAGGVATDDVLRSLLISQRRKGTTEVMVIGHVPCGMQGLDEPALIDEILKDGGSPPSFAMHAFTDPDQRVAQSVQTIRACSFLPHTDAVSGWIFDMETGELREVAVPEVSASRPQPHTAPPNSHSLGDH